MKVLKTCMTNPFHPQKSQPSSALQRGSTFFNLVLVLIIIGLIAIIALQAWDLQHYIEI